MKECYNYKILNSNTIQCFVCNHFCIIPEAQVGKCGVRKNLNNSLYSLVYGKVAATNVDPIEKKPLYHFLHGSYSYSIGTLGCNFQCLNCQNYDISQIGGFKGKSALYEKLNWGRSLSPAEIVDQALSFDCKSISYTYNEPTVFLEYALDTMKIAKKKNLKNIWITNGFMSEQTLELIFPYLDAVNVDLKSWDNNFYKNYCGAWLDPILENCKRLKDKGVWLEITTLIIPTLTDDETALASMADFIAEQLGVNTPWHISAFSGALSWKLKYLPDTSSGKIKRIEHIGKEKGLNRVYVGNI